MDDLGVPPFQEIQLSEFLAEFSAEFSFGVCYG